MATIIFLDILFNSLNGSFQFVGSRYAFRYCSIDQAQYMSWGIAYCQWRRIQGFLEGEPGHYCSQASLFLSQFLCLWTLQDCEYLRHRFVYMTFGTKCFFQLACCNFFWKLLCWQILKSIPGLDGKGRYAGADIFVHFVGGGLAGITAAAATYPLDLVRTRLAAQV